MSARAMSTFIVILTLVGPLYLLHFGFLGGFGAAIAQGGSEDHSIWHNPMVGAIASTGFGLLVPAWQLEGSPFAGPMPTLIGAAMIWVMLQRLTPLTTAGLRSTI